MTIIYILYFGVLNFLMFSFLTKKVDLTLKIKKSLFLVLGALLLMHFITTEIPNNHFLHLHAFSFALIIYHFGSAFTIWLMIKTAPSYKGHTAFHGFDFLRFYVIYIMIYIYQLISLLSTEAREHFLY